MCKRIHYFKMICFAAIVMMLGISAIHVNAAEETGVIPDSFEVPYIEEDAAEQYGYARRSRVKIPDYFDARQKGWITPPKNQGETQLCWAFSATACAETAAIKNSITNTPNYSEMHLGYFMGQPMINALGVCGNDSTYFINNSYLNAGGNNRYTTFALANWIGIADQKRYPNDSKVYVEQLPRSCALDDELHLQNAKWIAMTNQNFVKKAILEYGCVSSSYYNSSKYFNEARTAYHNPLFTNTNHSITIIGWDDHFKKEIFSQVPESDGAWLVKGSWGTEYQEDGCYWISYYDKSIMNASAFAFGFERANNYSHNYFYDGSYGTKTECVSSGGKAANVYTVCGNKNGADELLEAVGIAFADVNVDYTVQIFKNLTNSDIPNSGEAVLLNPIKGKTDAAGYYTISLEKPVRLRKGQQFSVVVTVNKANLADVNCFVDTTYENVGWIGFVNETEKGQSFIKQKGADWMDLDNKNETMRIKAFTTDTNMYSVASLSFKEEDITINPGETYFQKPIILPVQADLDECVWTSSDPKVATVTMDGLVTAVAEGETTVEIKGSDVVATYHVLVQKEVKKKNEIKDEESGNSADTDTVNKSEKTVKISKITLFGISKKIAAGKKIKLTAKVMPSNVTNKSVTWKSSNRKVATVNSKGVVILKKNSGGKTVTITATAKDGSKKKATYKITSMKGVVKKVTISGKRTVKAGKTLKLKAKVTATKKANKTLKWTSSNTKLAIVSSTGKVKTKKAGKGKKVKIIAAATDGSGKRRTVIIKIQ